MLKQILVGLVFAGLGGAMIYYSPGLIEMFGRVSRFDKNLGGTRNGYVLVGFGIIIIGFLIVFGVIPVNTQTEGLTQSIPNTQQ